jgi:hypothetical protein
MKVFASKVMACMILVCPPTAEETKKATYACLENGGIWWKLGSLCTCEFPGGSTFKVPC